MRIIAEGGDYLLEGTVDDDADLDGTFRMTTDDGDDLLVNGWLFVIEIVQANPQDGQAAR